MAKPSSIQRLPQCRHCAVAVVQDVEAAGNADLATVGGALAELETTVLEPPSCAWMARKPLARGRQSADPGAGIRLSVVPALGKRPVPVAESLSGRGDRAAERADAGNGVIDIDLVGHQGVGVDVQRAGDPHHGVLADPGRCLVGKVRVHHAAADAGKTGVAGGADAATWKLSVATA